MEHQSGMTRDAHDPAPACILGRTCDEQWASIWPQNPQQRPFVIGDNGIVELRPGGEESTPDAVQSDPVTEGVDHSGSEEHGRSFVSSAIPTAARGRLVARTMSVGHMQGIWPTITECDTRLTIEARGTGKASYPSRGDGTTGSPTPPGRPRSSR